MSGGGPSPAAETNDTIPISPQSLKQNEKERIF